MAKREVAISPEEFSEFLKGVVLLDLALEAAECAVFDRAAINTPEAEVVMQFGDDAGIIQVSETEATLRAYYAIRLLDPASTEERVLATLGVEFTVRYQTKTRMTDALFAIFRQMSLRIHTIPFAREWIYDQSHRMGIKPILLPLAISHPAAVPSDQGAASLPTPKERRA